MNMNSENAHDHDENHEHHKHHKHHKHNRHSHSKSVMNIEEIANGSSIANVNAGLKVLFSITLLIIAISFNNLYFSIVLTCSMLILLTSVAKLKISEICSLAIIPIVFILISCVAIMVQISPTQPENARNLYIFGHYFFVSKSTIMQAVNLFFRAYSAVLCLYFLATTTRLSDIIYFMQRCKFPKVFVELMYMIYRYLFVLFEVQNKLKQSANSRLGYSSYKASWKSFCGVASGVLISSFKRSSVCYDALESRCYDGELNFYCNNTKIKVKHVVLMSVYVIIMIMCGIILSVIGV